MEDAEELSSSYVSVGSSTRGCSGGGMEESLDFAKDLARSDIAGRIAGRKVGCYRSKVVATGGAAIGE